MFSHSLLGWAGSSLAFALALAGCKPAPQHGVLPFHDDALVHASRPPYQQASTATRASATPRNTSKSKPAERAPTKQRKTTTVPPSAPPPARPKGPVPTTIDADPVRARNADGYTPRLALQYVVETYAANGVTFANADQLTILDLHRAVQKSGTIYHSKTPVVGDLVFFHNTYDANGDRRNNDWYVHVGVIESVDRNNTIVVLSYRDGAVQRDRMNLTHPHEPRLEGEIINSTLRNAQKNDPAYTQYLAGQLFAGFGSILGDVEQVRVLEHWTPTQRR